MLVNGRNWPKIGAGFTIDDPQQRPHVAQSEGWLSYLSFTLLFSTRESITPW
jgi:hypothetical protein